MKYQNDIDKMNTNRNLFLMSLPIFVELLLQLLVGNVDQMMVSRVSQPSVAAIVNANQIMNLVIIVLSMASTAVTVILSQYLGAQDEKNASRTCMVSIVLIGGVSLAATILVFAGHTPLYRAIHVPEEVFDEASLYLLIVGAFILVQGFYLTFSAMIRAFAMVKEVMIISVIMNAMNIVGNAILIFGFHMGVAGAALSTLISRIFCAIVVMYFLRSPKEEICVRDYTKIRPDRHKIKMILALGIPTGIENGMFQFGKLAIQSTVSTLGTAAIAAQAMTNILENLNGIAAIGIGIGLMNVVGECIGAGRKDEAIYYTKKMCLVSEVVIIISCLLVFVLTKPIIHLGGMSAESGRMCFFMVSWITIIKPIVWVPAFIPAYSMRAVGDVKFSMILSCTTMWLCRVTLCVVLCRVFGFGPIAVWIGMFSDWTLRGIFYTLRFHGRKWLDHKVIE